MRAAMPILVPLRRVRRAAPALAASALLAACVSGERGPTPAPRWQVTVESEPTALTVAPATTAALARGPEPTPKPDIGGSFHALAGIASYYWQEQTTASGERFDRAALTAAHRTLPFGTRVRVINLANGRAVVVRINDRGPFKPGRVIDVSEAAAVALAMTGQGLARVRLEPVR
jgi:rare lipoprotein A